MTKPNFDEQRLHAFFDGELSPQERAEVEQTLARDPAARAYVDGLRLLQGAVGAGFEAEAAKVPEARFEQIWDEIERTLARESVREGARASWWTRLRGALRPALWTGAAVGAAAAVALLVRGPAEAPSSPDPVVAAKQAADEPVLSDSPRPEPEVVLPEPGGGPALIQRIQWSGKSGRISEIEGKRSTTTVIWISDDDEKSSERSL